MTTLADHATTLLVIEDSDTDARLLTAILDAAAPGAFAITRAATMAEATAILERTTVDCAVADLGLPDADGLQVITDLAAGWPSVALIVLTGREDDQLGLATIDAGANDYVFKRTVAGPALVRSIRAAIRRKRSETSLQEAQRIAQVGSWEMDCATVEITMTREMARLLALDTLSPSWEAMLERSHPDDQDANIQAIRTALVDHKPYLIEHRLLLPDGTVRWVRSRGRVELDAQGQVGRILGTAQDITVQKQAEEALVYQSLHDPTTDLPNRMLLVDRLTQAIHRLARNPTTVAAICLDIDRFKVINDNLGHAVGDQLLVAMTARLQSVVRPSDTLARTGGDEFVVVCEGLAGETEAIALAERYRRAMTAPLAWEHGDIVIAVSAGIALTVSASASAESLLRDADAAMYRAKGEGRARSVVFVETMRIRAAGRFDTEIALRRSILHGDLRLHYQPIVDLIDRQIVGHEALVRWAHPTRGLLGPDQFITIAEETGLIVPLGTWVLREACRQARQFQRRDPKWSELTMSVNLSGGQLGQADLIDVVAAALHDSSLAPEHLQLEMTESVLMDDAATTITILRTLKDLGVRLGVDDFGTGYSSLAYLKRFPVDVLKIDRTFVDGLGIDAEDSALVAAIVSLADALSLTSIAEGVETELQRDCLLGLGCSRAQGYLFSRPVVAGEIDAGLDRVAALPAPFPRPLRSEPTAAAGPVP